jgi:hypothetical protein
MEGVVLNGRRVAINSKRGREFVTDCIRAGEKLITSRELRAKYELSAETLRNYAKDEALRSAVRAEHDRRSGNGTTARKERQSDVTAKQLDVKPTVDAATDRFEIKIILSADVVGGPEIIETYSKPRKPGLYDTVIDADDPDHVDTPMLIAASKQGNDSGGGQPL